MAFKMKGGKDPMKKNFGSAMNFNAGLIAASKDGKLDDNPKFKAAVDKAPLMRMDPSAMKAMGKPAPVKAMDKSPMKNNGDVVDVSNVSDANKKIFMDKFGSEYDPSMTSHTAEMSEIIKTGRSSTEFKNKKK